MRKDYLEKNNLHTKIPSPSMMNTLERGFLLIYFRENVVSKRIFFLNYSAGMSPTSSITCLPSSDFTKSNQAFTSSLSVPFL